MLGRLFIACPSAGSQLINMAIKELTEWRDGFVKESEEKAGDAQKLVDVLRDEIQKVRSNPTSRASVRPAAASALLLALPPACSRATRHSSRQPRFVAQQLFVPQELAAMMAAFKEAEEMMATLSGKDDPVDMDFVDKALLASTVEDISKLLEGQILHCASKEELAVLQAALNGVQTSSDGVVAGEPGASSASLDALKESLFLMESRIGTKADVNELMALKAAMKKLASLRSSASQGSLTTKSISMCLVSRECPAHAPPPLPLPLS